MFKKCVKYAIIGLVLIFMYVPILILAVYSFTDSPNIGAIHSFSFHNYVTLFTTPELIDMIIGSIALAIGSAVLATILGTTGAIGAFYSKKNVNGTMSVLNQIPVVNADVVTGFSLCSRLVVVVGTSKNTYIPLRRGHTVLSAPFVYLAVVPKLKQMDPSLYEAALDLGATPGYTLIHIIIPQIASGIISGFVTAILQTKLGVDSLLAGIIVNTALYSVNIAVMGGSSLINMNRTTTVFTMMKDTLAGTPLKGREDIIIAAIAVILVIIFLVFFLKTRLGLAIRATGNNSDMVKSSSINPVFTTVIGLCVANAFTALSGCLLSQSQKSVDINIGQGMVTIALASLLIGGTILGRGGIFVRAVGMVLGSFIFRLVYTIALRFNMPAFMLKLVSSVIVVLAISGPYLKKQWPQIRRRMTHTKGGR